MRVRGKMNAVGGVRRLRTDPQGKSKNGRLWGEGMRVRRKMNGVGKRSELRTDPQRKGKGGGGWGGEKARGRENQKSSGR